MAGKVAGRWGHTPLHQGGQACPNNIVCIKYNQESKAQKATAKAKKEANIKKGVSDPDPH
jgi:hypothetical protein